MAKTRTADPRDHHRRRDRHRRAIARSKPPCGLCGEDIDYSIKDPHDPWVFEVDHIVAIADGGDDELSNKQASHRICNQRAGKKAPKLQPVAAVTFITDRNWWSKPNTAGM